METASAAKRADGKPLVNEQGPFRKDNVLGLHVMRREPEFGEAHDKHRAAE